ncbi:MAG: type II toxin-antitoxin system HicB family antitoxin [Acidobacteriia bacterium]|nr:type II toxin-antitoxin system HicB family antitoxin [Terriglobia bacterium]
MSTLSLRLPESLHRKIRQLADRDDISINQFIATAAAEKMAALLTVDYLEERGRRGDARLFDRVLARVPDVPPVAGDELPKAVRQADKAVQPASRSRRRTKARRSSRSARG